MGNAELAPGLRGTAEATVDAGRSAKAMGSGSEDVYATPALVALMEAAAVACIGPHLASGQISLGTHIAIDHLAASALGAQVRATAELTEVNGRALTFTVTAHQGETLIGQGRHVRAVVDRARFLQKLKDAP